MWGGGYQIPTFWLKQASSNSLDLDLYDLRGISCHNPESVGCGWVGTGSVAGVTFSDVAAKNGGLQ